MPTIDIPKAAREFGVGLHLHQVHEVRVLLGRVAHVELPCPQPRRGADEVVAPPAIVRARRAVQGRQGAADHALAGPHKSD